MSMNTKTMEIDWWILDGVPHVFWCRLPIVVLSMCSREECWEIVI